MSDQYLWRAWVDPTAAPAYTATTFLNDGLPFDHNTRANNGVGAADIQLSAGQTVTGYLEAALLLDTPYRGGSLIFAAFAGKDVVPAGTVNWGWTAYGTPALGGAEVALTAFNEGNGGSFADRTASLAAGVPYTAFRVVHTVAKNGAFVNVNHYDLRVVSGSQVTLAGLAGSGTLAFGGSGALTATAATATATATVTCTCHSLNYSGGHAPDCPFAYSHAASQVFTVAAPRASNFAVAGRSCQPFSVAGHACAPFTFNGGVQEGCECVTATATPVPPPVTAQMAATGTLTFGGMATLTATAVVTGTLFADTKFYAIYSSDNSLRRYDVPGSAWTTLIANVGTMTAANGKGAWDGRYYYFSGNASDRRLYRYNTATTAIEAVAGSAAMSDGAMIADDLTFASRGGVHNVYWVGSSAFGCYSVDNDSFTALPLPDTAFTYVNRLAWDQGRYLYCLGNNNSSLRHLLRWDLDSPGTWTQLSAPPALGGQPGDNGCTIIGNTLWNVVIGRSQVYRYDIDSSAWSTAITLTGFGSQSTHSVDDLGDSASIVFERFNAWSTATQAAFTLPATGLPVATPLAICYTHPFIW